MGMGVGNEKKRYKRFTNKNIRNVWEAVEQFGYTLYDLTEEYYDVALMDKILEEDFYDLINYANELRLEAISNLNN